MQKERPEAHLGVGKGHKNRHPRRGPQLSWLRRAEEILERIEASRQLYFDRRDLEAIFELQTTAAWRLMNQVGPTEELADVLGAGTRLQARVVARRDLILFISRARQSTEFFAERLRRDNLVDTLVRAAKHLAARRVRIVVDPAVIDMASLPAGVKLVPGLLEITFFGAEDLLTQLYSLAQAMASDFPTFQRLLEKP